ncbi:putative sugar transporter protein [Nocardioides sp. PD653]|nr:Putative sugar transporter protein [Nocardioides sp. PD653-B2]GAW54613.1 putative sugar transporter protein [Nocardioides sp. PD653]
MKVGFGGGFGAALPPTSADGTAADPHETTALATTAASTGRRARQGITIAPPCADSARRCNLGDQIGAKVRARVDPWPCAPRNRGETVAS